MNIGKIFALTGPSGIGKGYIKSHLRTQYPGLEELTVATTRGRRNTDGSDRDTGIPIGIFLEGVNGGSIIFAHQPFGTDGDWYGFYLNQIQRALINNRQVMTEIHVDNVAPFKSLFGEDVAILGLTAERDYLEANLNNRGSESPEEKALRLSMVLQEVTAIRLLHQQGLVNAMVEIDISNKEIVADIVRDRLESLGLGNDISYRSGVEYD